MTAKDMVKWFITTFPELYFEMSSTDHNIRSLSFPEDEVIPNSYHIEGSIWTHTMMVVQQAELNNASEIVLLSCLLHDIGKPASFEYNPEKNKNTFYNHEQLSAFNSLYILEKYPRKLSNEEKRRVFELICLHTEPLKRKPKDLANILINNYALYKDLHKLSYYDNLGRLSDIPNNVEYVDIPEREIEKRENTITFLIGLPGSGKSTYYKNMQNCYALSRDSFIENYDPKSSYNENWKNADQKKIDLQFNEVFKNALASRENIIVDKTNLTRKGRRSLLNQIPKRFYKKAIVFLPNLDIIIKRNNLRNLEGKDISLNVIERMAKTFYPPMYDEFDGIEYKFE